MNFLMVMFAAVSIVYCGRMTGVDPAVMQNAHDVTLRLYAKEGDSTAAAAWMQQESVTPDRNGTFSVALKGDGLAELIENSKVNYIGISVDGEQEITPRQPVLPVARVARTTSAGTLAADGSVSGSASLGSASAATLSIGALKVGSSITAPTSTNDFTIVSLMTGGVMKVTAPAVSVFDDSGWQLGGYNLFDFDTYSRSRSDSGIWSVTKLREGAYWPKLTGVSIYDCLERESWPEWDMPGVIYSGREDEIPEIIKSGYYYVYGCKFRDAK